jgi:hypothetical protein
LTSTPGSITALTNSVNRPPSLSSVGAATALTAGASGSSWMMTAEPVPAMPEPEDDPDPAADAEPDADADPDPADADADPDPAGCAATIALASDATIAIPTASGRMPQLV